MYMYMSRLPFLSPARNISDYVISLPIAAAFGSQFNLVAGRTLAIEAPLCTLSTAHGAPGRPGRAAN